MFSVSMVFREKLSVIRGTHFLSANLRSVRDCPGLSLRVQSSHLLMSPKCVAKHPKKYRLSCDPVELRVGVCSSCHTLLHQVGSVA